MQAENRPEELIYQLIEQVRQGYLPRRRFMQMLARMGISTIGVGAISSALLSSSAMPIVVKNADERESRNLHLHDQHLQHQSQGQSDKLSQDYAEDAVVEDSMHNMPLVALAPSFFRDWTTASTGTPHAVVHSPGHRSPRSHPH